jgi:hypothetical protein
VTEVDEMKATKRSDQRSPTAAVDNETLTLSEDPRKQVVGVILSDGTVYGVHDARSGKPRGHWAKGRFSGPGWIIWWERRVTRA